MQRGKTWGDCGELQELYGAGSGNRTRIICLEGRGFAIKLCPPVYLHSHLSAQQYCCARNLLRNTVKRRAGHGKAGPKVGERGFEPPTPASQTLCAARLRYSPKLRSMILLWESDFCNYSDTGMKTTSQRIAQQQRNTDNGGNCRDHCGYLRVSMLVPPLSVFMVVALLCVALRCCATLR